VSIFDSLRKLFGRTDQVGSTDSSQSTGTTGAPTGAATGVAGEAAAAAIACAEASARLFEYLDGELEAVSEEEVRLHLEVCEGCYPRVQFEKHFMEALRRSQNGGRVSDDLRDRVLQSLTEDERLD
jgi:mycothiol system anti-sigma-R factor